MKVPQIIVSALFLVSLLVSSNHHGRTYEVKENFWVSLGVAAGELAVLIWGGFFA